jgi:hypothetical protein
MQFAALLCLFLSMAMSLMSEERLMMDTENREYQRPRRYRSANTPLKFDQATTASLEGLYSLPISASAQFSKKELETVLKTAPAGVIVLDLRQECHGFVDGIPVSWYGKHNAANFGKTLLQIEKEENARLAYLKASGHATLHTVKPSSSSKDIPWQVEVKGAQSEESLCRELKIGYMRLPITDHLAPDIASCDRFVRFAARLPENTWVHVHCRGGHGRSSTIMIMFDMMKNAKKVSFSDILYRQWLQGNDNLAKVPEALSWRLFRKIERYEFLRRFYDYCKEADQSFSKSYSEWLSSRVF